MSEFTDQVKNIQETVDLAIINRRTEKSTVRAPFMVNEDQSASFLFHYCEMFVSDEGFLAFKPTKYTYERECSSCGEIISI